MKKSLSVVTIAIILALPQLASARNVWRECGIGGMLFKSTGWAAITSNIIWDLGSTATSSNVSSDDLCEGPTASTASFMYETYANLEEEIAVGEGEHLAAMLSMMGCSNTDAMVEGLRADMSQNVGNKNYSSQTRLQKAESLYNSSMTHAQAGKCNAI